MADSVSKGMATDTVFVRFMTGNETEAFRKGLAKYGGAFVDFDAAVDRAKMAEKEWREQQTTCPGCEGCGYFVKEGTDQQKLCPECYGNGYLGASIDRVYAAVEAAFSATETKGSPDA